MTGRHITKKDMDRLLGGVGEYKFFAKLMELGYLVYVPLLDLKGVDCIATKDHKRFLQFQVKSSTKGTDYALFRIGQKSISASIHVTI